MGNEDIHNRKYLIETRKSLRKNLTPAETAFWRALKSKGFQHLKFRRQHSIENFIVDFYCASQKLIIELDGEVHNELRQANYDYERDKRLAELGYTVLRFENKLIWENLEGIFEEISKHCKNVK
ncbi:MAG: endonuclease domain-containing protein [Sphingobacteriales bacterium]|nr:MAG: endonuclease domain-containing protein [Sphingobacteriales bacterium]